MNIKRDLRKPIVLSLIGCCGSGKSTLAKKLAKDIEAQALTIGEFRDIVAAKCKKDGQDPNEIKTIIELQAWLLLFYTTLNEIREHKNIILDTSGLNKRLRFLIDNLWGTADVVKVKLVCPLSKLKKRLAKRRPRQCGFFPYDYASHSDLNKDLYKALRNTRADITVDSGKLNADQVFKKVVKELNRYGY